MEKAKELLKKPAFCLKCCELIATVVSFSLLQETDLSSHDFTIRAFINMVTGSYLMIIPMDIAGIVMEQKTSKNLIAIALKFINATSNLALCFSQLFLQSFLSNYYKESLQQNLTWAALGAVMWTVAGGLQVYSHESRGDQFPSSSISTFANSAIFIGEGLMEYKSDRDMDWKGFLPLFKK